MFSLVARQPVKFIVEGGQFANRQPAYIPRCDQSTRPAVGASHMFHQGIADGLHSDAIIMDLGAFAGQFPEFALLLPAVAIDEQVADSEMPHDVRGMVDRFAHDDRPGD